MRDELGAFPLFFSFFFARALSFSLFFLVSVFFDRPGPSLPSLSIPPSISRSRSKPAPYPPFEFHARKKTTTTTREKKN